MSDAEMNGKDSINPAYERRGALLLPNGGLTKREMFAAMAMQGAMGNAAIRAAMDQRDMTQVDRVQAIAQGAVLMADALLLALEDSK